MNNKPVDDALSNTFTALEAWVDALPTNWNATATHTVPLPSNLNSEDIRRVALYATTVDDAEILCQRIDVQHPKRSFAPLLLLSEMISFAHPRLRTVVQEHLKSDTIIHIAIHGHAQCREPAGRLFLRLWGAVLSQQHASDIVLLLRNSLESLKSEALVCISSIAVHHPSNLYNIREALNTGEAVTDETLLDFFRLYQSAENTQMKDIAALLLLWSLVQNLSQWQTYSLSINDVLKIVIERCQKSEEANIQLALLDGLSNLYMNTVALEAIFFCGGIALLSDLLRNMKHRSFFHEALPFYHDSVETPFESIVKQARCLTQYPEARCKIKSTDIPCQLADVARDQAFLQHERSGFILETYLQPFFADVDFTPSLRTPSV